MTHKWVFVVTNSFGRHGPGGRRRAEKQERNFRAAKLAQALAMPLNFYANLVSAVSYHVNHAGDRKTTSPSSHPHCKLPRLGHRSVMLATAATVPFHSVSDSGILLSVPLPFWRIGGWSPVASTCEICSKAWKNYEQVPGLSLDSLWIWVLNLPPMSRLPSYELLRRHLGNIHISRYIPTKQKSGKTDSEKDSQIGLQFQNHICHIVASYSNFI